MSRVLNIFVVSVLIVIISSCGGGGGGLGPASLPLPSAKVITAFSLAGISGVINEANKTVAVMMPYGTSLSALIATFTTTGSSIAVGFASQTSGSTPNNFTNPVTYIVIAADSSSVSYAVTVTVTVAANSAKAITAFSLAGISGSIDETNKTVTVMMPYGTNLSALIATFTTTGSSIAVGVASQTSGSTPNNFTNPVTYTVTAADSSSVRYAVAVTLAYEIYIGYPNYVYGINPSSGATMHQISPTSGSTPAMVFGTDGLLYLSYPNLTYGVNSTTGAIVKQFTNPGAGSGVTPSVTFGTDGFIYLGYTNYVYGINPSSGATVHQIRPAGGSTTAMVYGTDGLLYLSYPNLTYGVNSTTGAIVKQFINPGTGSGVTPSVTFGTDGLIYLGYTNYVYGINPSSGATVHQIRPAGGSMPAMVFGTDGLLYLSYPNLTYGVNSTTGAIVTQFTNPGAGSGVTPSVTFSQ